MRSGRIFGAAAALAAAAAGAVAATSGGSVTATGTTTTSGRPTLQQGDDAARAAIALWKRFPVSQQPRPIVIPSGLGIVNAPADQREDLALYNAKWNIAPPNANDLVTARRHKWISPTAAISALGNGLKHAPAPKTALAMRIRLGRASFVTDRGMVSLPAWQFSVGRFREAASVLAVIPFTAPPLRRLDPNGVGNSQDGERAIVAADDRSLTISFIGDPAGSQPCDASYTVRVDQSTRAVAFTIYEHPVAAPLNTVCDLVGYTRTVVAHLIRPLGPRVLVNSTDGGAIAAASRPTFG